MFGSLYDCLPVLSWNNLNLKPLSTFDPGLAFTFEHSGPGHHVLYRRNVFSYVFLIISIFSLKTESTWSKHYGHNKDERTV